VPGVGTTPRRTVVAEDVRDLQGRTGHGRRYYVGGWSVLLFLGFLRGSDNKSRGLAILAIMPVATRV
jgi:hypothetical protein